jgi:hypothetical protein
MDGAVVTTYSGSVAGDWQYAADRRLQVARAPLGAQLERSGPKPDTSGRNPYPILRHNPKTLDVSCACGRSVKPFDRADVLLGECQWFCGHVSCPPMPRKRNA